MFGHFTTQLLRQCRQFVGGLLHERVLGRLFSQILQVIALRLLFFTESADFIASFLAEVLLSFRAKLSDFGDIECQFLRQLPQSFKQFAIGLLKCLQSNRRCGVGHLQDPRALPDGLGTRAGAFVGCASSQFQSIALLQCESFEIQSEVKGDGFSTCFQWFSRLNAEGFLIAAEVQFQHSDADVVCGDGVERNNVIGSNFQAIADSGGLQHGRFVGHSGQSSVGWFADGQTDIIVSLEFEASAPGDSECQLGLQAIG